MQTEASTSLSFGQVEGVWSTGVIPKGTRFGPFEGRRTPNYPSDKSSWRYYWRVSTDLLSKLLRSFPVFFFSAVELHNTHFTYKQNSKLPEN